MNIEAANRAQASLEVCISIAAGKVKDRAALWSTIGTFHSSVFDLTRPRWVVRFLGRGFASSVLFRVRCLFDVEIL